MQFSEPLKEGLLLKRYKRFFADIRFKGETITAHLPNTGSLKTVPLENTSCRFSTSNDPKRKLKYTLEMIKTENDWAGVNTRIPNIIVKEALKSDFINSFKNFQSEVKISEKTRIDFILYNGEQVKLKYPDFLSNFKKKDLHFIEVKNVTMKNNNTALFPDGVTLRGTKHLNELIQLSKKGYSTEILFTLQRQNCSEFKPAEEIDPIYSKTIREAKKAGVKISAYNVDISKSEIKLNIKDKIKICI